MSAQTPADPQPGPIVSIVGAGPGAVDLITLRAADRLRAAEVLLWTDSLVAPEIASLTDESCERIATSGLTLEEICELMIQRARSGRRVVRLHDGDPCLYSALNEQRRRLAEAGLGIEVVPGVSAYQAVAAALPSELTVPGLVQTIVLSRASGRTGTPERETLSRLAGLRASLCLYLSARHVQDVQDSLLEHYPADTPVAIGYRVSWPDQWLRLVELREMAACSREQGLTRTTLYLVSPALAAPSPHRSRLYSASHGHLFRPASGAGAGERLVAQDKAEQALG
ncbi:precorrin-4 C(11)-methyltransferase [Synechococcus sp. RSCCF101]|uniref:precorrin-4 C(11)-methyltransferase n=1 Tax=Synechococcus sp. RSCCF101 TaxID=2511069 RepID=UPI001247A81D|nr:precorrin-4 C(11)-methyltransferase [Synechococcus sp. RSCCF101]QEY30959.1 precorrin-4 C(11)-methyltransferase [Synechococcus sp. RSCCF101]